jgi:hypothetical protein
VLGSVRTWTHESKNERFNAERDRLHRTRTDARRRRRKHGWERVSLERYGVTPQDIVRAPVQDRHDDDDLKACPECGHVVGEPTTRKIDGPNVVDDVHLDALITRAYKCQRHGYDVLLPERVAEAAPSHGDEWTTVRVQYADGRVRHVAVPKRVIVE